MESNNKKIVLAIIDSLHKTVENAKGISDFDFKIKISFNKKSEVGTWVIEYDFGG